MGYIISPGRFRSNGAVEYTIGAIPSARLYLQALNHPAIYQVLINNFVNIRLVNIAVPDIIRVDDNDRPFGTAIQTTGRVDTHLARPGNCQFLAALFGVIAQRLRIETLTAS